MKIIDFVNTGQAHEHFIVYFCDHMCHKEMSHYQLHYKGGGQVWDQLSEVSE